MTYNLGLDIGIASIGFGGVDPDAKKILFCGAHIFDAAENPKDGASLAAPRREKRGMRRVIHRRSARKKAIRRLLAEHGLKDIESIDLSRTHKKTGKEVPPVSPWDLRRAALERKLTDAEFARVLFHIAKRRGFQSNRKGAEPNDIDRKTVLAGIVHLEERRIQAGCQTAAAYLATQAKKRNGNGDYDNSVARDALREEVKLVFAAQRKFGNEKATEALQLKYAGSGKKEERNTIEGDGVAFFQRPLQSSWKLVGDCTFEKGEKRAPKFSWTAERFVLWGNLNRARIRPLSGKERELSFDEKRALADLAYKNKGGVTYAQARKALELPDDVAFNISYRGERNDNPEQIREKTEKRVFLQLPGYHALKSALDTGNEKDWRNWTEERRDDLDEIARILSFYEDKKEVDDLFSRLNLTEPEKERLGAISGFAKTIDLSLKALRKILPDMERGIAYDEACKSVWGHHSRKESKGLALVPQFDDIPNPVVHRALAQARKVINACLRKYGMPETIVVELAREVGKPLNGYWIDASGKKLNRKGDSRKGDRYVMGRRDVEKENLKNWEKRQDAAKNVAKEFGKNPEFVTGSDILKYRLWEEQKEACPYCGEIISATAFKADDETQIDHILPYAQSQDDSYMNKVLVHRRCNQSKGNNVPFSVWGRQPIWDRIVAVSQFLPKAKRDRLLIEDFDPRESGYKDRALNDTRYMAKALKNHLSESLPCKIEVRNGAITAHLRGMWGFTDEKLDEIVRIVKSGADEKEMAKNLATIGLKDYHVKAALHVRTLEQAELKKVLRGLVHYKDRTNDRHHALDAVVLACSTQSMVQNVANDTRYNKGRREYPKPWDTFRDDALRAVYGGKNPDTGLYEGGIFVSRMPVRKTTGAAHEETIRSIRKADGKVIQRVKLQSLPKPGKNDPDPLRNIIDSGTRNKKLYALLKDRLDAHGGDPKKAFAEPVYMPTNDPAKQGPRIHSIRIETSEKSGVPINDGLASNGDMIRVDVFQKDGKFQLVPVYVHHFAQQTLPNRAIVAFKDEKDWLEVEDGDFLFSLYRNDLVFIKNKKEEFLGYYVGTHRGTGCINIRTHDSDPAFGKEGVKEGIGVKTLLAFHKYSVDYFGDKRRIEKERRLGVAHGDDSESSEAEPVPGAVAAGE